ncbi:MAG: GNAT family N-acetyltransferase [Chloroflexi bacterium]|nr:GNAT family N-acetyltransferase [Chloroflexota bacterium]
MSTDEQLFDLVRPWIEDTLGCPFPNVGSGPLVVETPDHAQPLFGVRRDMDAAFSVREQWIDPVGDLARDLHPDLLFSVTGSYDLSRITLPDGVAVWGPAAYYAADESTWSPISGNTAVRLTPEQVAAVDTRIFWHCEGADTGIAHFGVYEQEQLVALTSVKDHGFKVHEIGIDVLPEAKSQGLGSNVLSATGDWILEQGATIIASVALWNVPSGRNMRRRGLRYVFNNMLGSVGPFKVGPQPLGTPLPGMTMVDLYPKWAMNKAIVERVE